MQKNHYVHWLVCCPELTGKTLGHILERYPEPEELLRVSMETVEELAPKKQAAALWKHLKQTKGVEEMKERYEKMKSAGISFVSLGEAGYPQRLSQIPDPPRGIYYRGRLPEENVLSVAVVGSRDCSEYGSYVAGTLGSFLGERGVAVISGMARGIDGISQRAALLSGGESYGVLGCGVDICYPASNKRLYDTLMEQGGVLSPYPPGTPPVGYHFPPRNRIVSGLSQAVVVVEAARKSGTSITVSMALEQGRDVYVVPGRVTDRLSDGCNLMIKQGAEVFLDPESFLEELQETFFLQQIRPEGKEAVGKRTAVSTLPGELAELWEAMEETPLTVEEIQGRLKSDVSIQTCSIRLMELVLRGKARQVTAGHFCRN